MIIAFNFSWDLQSPQEKKAYVLSDIKTPEGVKNMRKSRFFIQIVLEMAGYQIILEDVQR